MKKSLFIIGIAFSLMIASCTVFSLQIRPTEFKAIGESERNSGLVTISVQTAWENAGPGKGNGPGNNPGDQPGNGNNQGQMGHDRISGFSVVFHNNTNSPVLILWEKSSIRYNGGAYAPFIEGQQFGNVSGPMHNTVIPARGMVRKNIFSSQQPYNEPGNHGGWKMRSISADNVVLVFCVQSRDIEDYYTIAIR